MTFNFFTKSKDITDFIGDQRAYNSAKTCSTKYHKIEYYITERNTVIIELEIIKLLFLQLYYCYFFIKLENLRMQHQRTGIKIINANPQQAASTMAMQNASVNDVFKNMLP